MLGTPFALAIGPADTVYVATVAAIRMISASGSQSILAGGNLVDESGRAAQVSLLAICVDAAGNLYGWSSTDGTPPANYIVRITPEGVVSKLAGGPKDVTGGVGPFDAIADVTCDRAGNVYMAVATNGGLLGAVQSVSATGVVTTFATGIGPPGALTIDQTGTFYVTASSRTNGWGIGRITPSGMLTAIAPKNGDGSAAMLSNLVSIGADGTGNIYLTDTGSILKIDATGLLSTLVKGTGIGDVLSGATTGGPLVLPSRLAVDSGGNVYLLESGKNGVRKIAPDGSLTTLAQW